jgi:hypothetical protein
LARALLLRSRADFEIWLWNYVRTLVKNSLVDKLRELCTSLLGNPYGDCSPAASTTAATSTEFAATVRSDDAGVLSAERQGCSELVDMFFSTQHAWKPQLLGVNKRSLLKEILPLIRNNTAMQRLAEEFEHTLQELSERSSQQE